MNGHRLRAQRPLLIVTVAATILIAIAGCRGGADPLDPGTAQPTPSATHSASPTASPTATPTPSAEPSTPINAACEELVPIDVLYAINPNFSLVPGPAVSGEPFDTLLAAGGVACGVTYPTASATAVVVVAEPSATVADELRAAAGSPLSVANGVEMFGTDAVGQAYNGTRWFAVRADEQGAIPALMLLGALVAN